ncbi:hypothetical protein FO519_003434 [Halicephalobus sp. NKZ332]|nr:hypothetical protein FO519_003434 [Halicephalobus sp. NKZ332]
MTAITGDLTVANMRVLGPLIYIIPTFLLYFLLLKIIFFSKNREKFRTSFYSLFGVSAINNMVYCIFYFIFYRTTNAPIFLPLLSLLPERHFLLTMVPWIMFHAMYTQNFLDCIIAFNRFTVIYLKTNYRNFWKKHLLQILVTDVAIKFMNESDPDEGYRWDMFRQDILPPWWKNASNMALVTLVTASLSLFFNFYVSFKLLKQKFLKTKENLKFSRQDFQLTIFSCFLFLNQIGNFTLQVMFIYVTDEEQKTEMFRAQFWVVDVNTMTPAWFLCIMSRNIRRELIDMFRCNSIEPQQESTVFSTGPSKQPPPIIVFINASDYWGPCTCQHQSPGPPGVYTAFLHPLRDPLKETGFWITFIPYILFNTMYIQNMLDLLLCFNRFTVLTLKTRYQGFWKRNCAWMIVLCCLSGLPFTW